MGIGTERLPIPSAVLPRSTLENMEDLVRRVGQKARGTWSVESLFTYRQLLGVYAQCESPKTDWMIVLPTFIGPIALVIMRERVGSAEFVKIYLLGADRTPWRTGEWRETADVVEYWRSEVTVSPEPTAGDQPFVELTTPDASSEARLALALSTFMSAWAKHLGPG
jgi:hypothetical protein